MEIIDTSDLNHPNRRIPGTFCNDDWSLRMVGHYFRESELETVILEFMAGPLVLKGIIAVCTKLDGIEYYLPWKNGDGRSMNLVIDPRIEIWIAEHIEDYVCGALGIWYVPDQPASAIDPTTA